MKKITKISGYSKDNLRLLSYLQGEKKDIEYEISDILPNDKMKKNYLKIIS